jgi:hypothetical protein
MTHVKMTHVKMTHVKACQEQGRCKEGAEEDTRVRARKPGPAHVCSAASAGDAAMGTLPVEFVYPHVHGFEYGTGPQLRE